MKIILSMTLTGLLSSCASVHNGNYAVQSGSAPKTKNTVLGEEIPTTKSGLIISGMENRGLASKHFMQLDFTFQNTDKKWKKITDVKLSFEKKSLDNNIKIPVGQKLMLWAQASQQMKEIEDYNTSLVLGSIAALGGVAMNMSSSKTKQAGTIAALGATSGLAVNGLSNKLDNLQLSSILPESHLLSEVTYVPPGLHTKRWITLYAENPNEIDYLENIKISYKVDGKRESVTLKIRTIGSSSASDFQFKKSDQYRIKNFNSRQDKSW